MYKQVEIHILLNDMTKKEVADLLGISYNTFILKLNKKSKFTLDEAVKLKEILNTSKPIEELFC